MLFRPLFATVLIGVNYSSTACNIKVVKKRGGHIVEESDKEFKILEGNLSAEVIKFIKKLKSRYAYSYVAILSKSTEQILVPGSKKNQFSAFNVNEKEYKFIKLPSAFAFILKDDVTQYQAMFKKAKGLDFLFSPFVLIFFKAKTFVTDKPKLFALQEKENLSVLILTRKAILYGSFLPMSAGEQIANSRDSVSNSLPNDTLVSTTSSSASSTAQGLDDLNIELGGLEDELEDYEHFDFDSITSSVSDNVSGSSDSDDNSSSMDIQDLGRSTTVINLLQAAIKDFYNNSLYDSDFIEEIVLFDCYGISTQAVDNIRSNLMIDLSLVSIDLLKEITNVIQVELDS